MFITMIIFYIIVFGLSIGATVKGIRANRDILQTARSEAREYRAMWREAVEAGTQQMQQQRRAPNHHTTLYGINPVMYDTWGGLNAQDYANLSVNEDTAREVLSKLYHIAKTRGKAEDLRAAVLNWNRKHFKSLNEGE